MTKLSGPEVSIHHMRALSSDTRVGAIQRQLQSELEGLGHLSESIRMADCEPGLFEVVEHRIECLAEVRSWLRYGLDYRPDWYGDLITATGQGT